MKKNDVPVNMAATMARALGRYGAVLLAAVSMNILTTTVARADVYFFNTLVGNAIALDHTDGAGGNARFLNSTGVAVDAAGNIYVADGGDHTVRKVTAAGVVTTLAGSSGQGGSSDGAGANARFVYPFAIAVDGTGNVYVTDIGNHNIRKITAGGTVTTLAGSAGVQGSLDGFGTAAQFSYPQGIAVDGVGNVYVGDTNNSTIRKIAANGVVTTFAGVAGQTGTADGTGASALFNYPWGLAVDVVGNIYVADQGNSTIRKIDTGGTVTTLAGSAGLTGGINGQGTGARFDHPSAVSVDGGGNVYVIDTSNQLVRKISVSGSVSTLAGTPGQAGRADGAGAAARFFYPQGIAVNSAGTVYVADTGNHTLRVITPAGVVATLAGAVGLSGSTDGAGTAARFAYPYGVAVDGSGNLYIADHDNHTIRKVNSSGVVTTLAGAAGISGSAEGVGGAARFNGPTGVAVDGSGNVYVADAGNSSIRKITAGGTVTTFAGFSGVGGSSDGVGGSARFNVPQGIAIDSAGNVYVADTNNSTIRKVTAAGTVTTIAGAAGQTGSSDGFGAAARFNGPFAVAVDSAGNVYVADFSNATIRKITATGFVTTLAGFAGQVGLADGFGGAARFNQPYGVAVDGSGNVFVADTYNRAVREITAAGSVTTLSGSRFYYPQGIAVDGAGNLFIADGDNQSVTKAVFVASPPSGTPVASPTVAPGQSATFTLGAAISQTTYQWQISTDFGATWTAISNNSTYSGATTTTLNVANVTIAMNGNRYRAQLANAAGTGISGTATLTVGDPGTVPTGAAQLTNVSVRTTLTANQILTVGLTMQGGPKSVLIRAAGPGLAAFGVTGTMADPKLALFNGTTQVAFNDNWAGDAGVAAAISAVGAFPFATTASLDAALVSSIDGGRTVQVSGPAAGNVIVEVYDAGTGSPRLINLSALNRVGTGGDVLIAGFTLAGAGTRNLLIRAVGPSLSALGVVGTLADPKLELYNSAQIKIGENDNYAAALASTFSSVGAFPLTPGSKDAALVVALAAGGYTVQVSGADGGTGTAIVEIYELP